MILRTSIEAFDKGLSILDSLVNDKFVKESMRNVTIWFSESGVRLVGQAGNNCAYTSLDAEVIYGENEEKPENDQFLSVKAKTLSDIFGAFRGLHKTYVSHVDFVFGQENQLLVYEEVRNQDAEVEVVESFKEPSRYKLIVIPVKETVKEKLLKQLLKPEGEPEVVGTAELSSYFLTLLPLLVTSEKAVAQYGNTIIFTDESVYTVAPSFIVILSNILGKAFQHVTFTGAMANIIKNIIESSETIDVYRKDMKEQGIVVLYISAGDSVASIVASDDSHALNLEGYKGIPESGVVVDKEYMLDVLKRMSLDKLVRVEADIDEGVLKVESSVMHQTVPLLMKKGAGVFKFTLDSQILSSIVLAHATWLGSNLFLYFAQVTDETVNLIVSDELQTKEGKRFWLSRVNRLSAKNINAKW